jgi:hypothetical protein
MDQLDFLETEPWETLTADMANALQKELNSELVDTHILFGKSATALAHRIDNDDVIFWIDELQKYAVVHLTWSKNNSLSYPKTAFFSLDDLRYHCKRESELY